MALSQSPVQLFHCDSEVMEKKERENAGERVKRKEGVSGTYNKEHFTFRHH